jgi:hypothetical protein
MRPRLKKPNVGMSRGKGKTATSARPVPIPPLSVVRVSRKARSRYYRAQPGAVFRVGYYSRMDGLDCIWLVNDNGQYQEAVDHEFLYRNFDVIQLADIAIGMAVGARTSSRFCRLPQGPSEVASRLNFAPPTLYA